MIQKIKDKMLEASVRLKLMLEQERGEVNMIAMILIIVAVVGIAAIFGDNLKVIVQELINRIREALDLEPITFTN